MDRRERLLGIAEKVPKKVADNSARRQIIALESRRAPQAPLIAAAADATSAGDESY